MKSVVLRAPMLTQSGYGVHSRQVARWLIEKHESKSIKLFCQCVNWGSTPWKLNQDDENGLIGKVMECSRPAPAQPDISFQNPTSKRVGYKFGKVQCWYHSRGRDRYL